MCARRNVPVSVVVVQHGGAWFGTKFASVWPPTEDAPSMLPVGLTWATKPYRVAVPVAVAALELGVLDVGELDDLVRELEQPAFRVASWWRLALCGRPDTSATLA